MSCCRSALLGFCLFVLASCGQMSSMFSGSQDDPTNFTENQVFGRSGGRPSQNQDLFRSDMMRMQGLANRPSGMKNPPYGGPAGPSSGGAMGANFGTGAPGVRNQPQGSNSGQFDSFPPPQAAGPSGRGGDLVAMGGNPQSTLPQHGNFGGGMPGMQPVAGGSYGNMNSGKFVGSSGMTQNGGQFGQGSGGSYQAFGRTLAVEYREKSINMRQVGKFAEAELFKNKSAIASSGGSVMPESYARWKIPYGKTARLDESRKKLENIKSRHEIFSVVPEEVAKLQVLHDCMIVEVKDGISDYGSCTSEFYANLGAFDELLSTLSSKTGKSQRFKKGSGSKNYSIYFASGSTGLSPGAMIAVDEIAGRVSDCNDYSVEISGSSDKSGNQKLNNKLARQRADSVARALVFRGADGGRITVTSAPSVTEISKGSQAPDGVVRAFGRRASVSVKCL